MPGAISITELVRRVRPDLHGALEREGPFSEVQPSPELVDLLIWNVVVGFVVSVVSNAAYDGLVYCLQSKGRVEPSDLSKLQNALNTPIVISSLNNLMAAEEQISTMLQTQYLYSETNARNAATQAVELIVSQVDANA